MPGKGAVGVVLVPEQPFPSDHIGTRRSRYKAPGIVGDESIVLLGHCSALVGIGEGAMIVCWNWRGSHGGEVEALHWTQAASLSTEYRRQFSEGYPTKVD